MPQLVAPGNVHIIVPTAELRLTGPDINSLILQDELRARRRKKRWNWREDSLGALLEQILRPGENAQGAGPDVWKFYNNFHLWIADGTFDLDGGGAFTFALFQTAAGFATLTNSLYGDLSSEVANGNGYATGGVALDSVTWTIATATAKFTSAGAVWTASGSGIATVRAAVLYLNATANSHVKPLMCYSLLDNTPADVPTIASGNTLTITPNASGIFTLTG